MTDSLVVSGNVFGSWSIFLWVLVLGFAFEVVLDLLLTHVLNDLAVGVAELAHLPLRHAILMDFLINVLAELVLLVTDNSQVVLVKTVGGQSGPASQTSQTKVLKTE